MLLPQLQLPPPLSSLFLLGHCVHLLPAVKRTKRVMYFLLAPRTSHCFRSLTGTTEFRGLGVESAKVYKGEAAFLTFPVMNLWAMRRMK